MTTLSFLKMYAVGVMACFALDLVWLGLLVKVSTNSRSAT